MNILYLLLMGQVEIHEMYMHNHGYRLVYYTLIVFWGMNASVISSVKVHANTKLLSGGLFHQPTCDGLRPLQILHVFCVPC